MGRNLSFIRNTAISAGLIAFVVGCFNPFFPESGGALREPLNTPEKTIQALHEAYEQSSLLRFQELIWNSTEFNSYIEYDDLSYTAGLTRLPQYQVTIDTVVQSVYIPTGQTFLELNWAQEESVHSKLLDSRNELAFATPLTVAGTDYVLDSTGSEIDYAVVKVLDTELNIIVDGDTLAPFSITGQHFVLKQDESGDWKIWKWIELN